ncbi:MAG TPA: FAD-dependent oxidoreductase [Vicinamibacterales bacterium]|jgi:glycerol-3-phosphate dehydrogenase|nr:FAD-dependent oxidoreductase [Vicinamibacterales bacterium]
MTRDLGRLGRTRYDVLVVGGGIHGLFAAYDAASRGLSVALVERDDFGAGLSFNHQRTIHGGLRALEGGHVAKAVQQIRERRTWARIAPHYVRPLPFLIGTYRGTKRSRALIGVGFAIYDLLGRRRNAGVASALRLPASHVVSRDRVEASFPGIARDGLTGGAIWYDYQARHPDRINGIVARAAIAAGADLASYVEAVEPLRANGRVTGARVRVWPTGESLEIEATATLLCAGGGLAALHASFGLSGAPPLVRASNLVLDRPAPAMALAAPGRSGRMLTCVPWNGIALVGTFQSETTIDPSDLKSSETTIDSMLFETAVAFPFLGATADHVRVVHQGLTPAIVRNGRVDLLPEPQIIRHRDAGAPGVTSLVGVKFTTARAAAAQAIDVLCEELGRANAQCRTADVLLPGAGSSDTPAGQSFSGLDAEASATLIDWYGTEAADVAAYCATHGLTRRLAEGGAVLAGEIGYAVEHGAAVRLADVVLRRTRLGGTGHPGAVALSAAADLMTSALGWSSAERASEIAHVETRYPRVTTAR